MSRSPNRPHTKYSKLIGRDPSDEPTPGSAPEDVSARAPPRVRGRVWLVLGVALANLLGLWVGIVLGRHASANLDAVCAAYTTRYSPLLGEVGIAYSAVDFNGSFMVEDVYRRAGSPETDAAWEALGVDYRASIISTESGLQSGLTRAHVQRAEAYGGGFFVNVEGMHHLHCLNLVRKALFYNYDYYKALGTHAFANEDRIVRLHVSHCLDIVRQVLMCNVDTGVLGQVWFDPDKPAAFPDFKTRHLCKNYDAVRRWARDHQAPPPDMLPPGYLAAPNEGDVLAAVP